MDIAIEKIFEEVIDLLYRKCWSKQRVCSHLKEKYEWKTSRAYGIIAEAREYFAKYSVEANKNLLDECLRILESTRELAKEQGNLKEVRECTKEIASLNQLYIKKLDITSKGESININIS